MAGVGDVEAVEGAGDQGLAVAELQDRQRGVGGRADVAGPGDRAEFAGAFGLTAGQAGRAIAGSEPLARRLGAGGGGAAAARGEVRADPGCLLAASPVRVRALSPSRAGIAGNDSGAVWPGAKVSVGVGNGVAGTVASTRGCPASPFLTLIGLENVAFQGPFGLS
ncbi:hypothetical protein [Embleya sp. NPDC020630]|uniref:hypothetical protein n=1 Tax=Embleya sp. NPDC020630 TaxID=3363979 RepID=UPI003787B213